VPERWTLTVTERRALEAIRSELGRVGLVLPGSLTVRSYRCGKANCACHAETPRLHGPYNQWSHRSDNKTVHVNLSPERLDDYQQLLAGHQRLKMLIDALEQLSLAVVERDLRSEATPATRPDRSARS
jgi:hypothetical protein